MSTIREELIHLTLNRAWSLIDYNIQNESHKQYEFMLQAILADNSLTNDEKNKAIRLLNIANDREKVLYNEGTRRICENCNQECLATLYCEYCVRDYLKANFSNWASGNVNIDNLIQKCQIKTLLPSKIIEWISYNNLQGIEYLTKGGFSKIYTAIWIGGRYDEWNSENQQLQRFGELNVILKELDNVGNASQNWFEEAESHLTISNKHPSIVACFGLTRNPLNGNYMLVMERANISLRGYLQQNNNKLTWNERIKINYLIINSLYYIHNENSIHRDLHSGNILHSQFNDYWYISDLGFCGPADKPSTSIYGNLPYIAPEVLSGNKYTFKSDIYSIAMLMWEISSGQPPFNNHKHDYNLAINIINGMRPKIISEIPLKYKNLMVQCWDANPLKRPDVDTLRKEIREINLYYQNNPNELPQLKTKLNEGTNHANTSSKLFTSKIHKFENLPKPKNATEEEQETPEVLSGNKYTFKSDIYSIAMLMWEISSGQPPFNNHKHDYNLAINIINGMRPKIISEIPLKYKNLMVQCWDANPLKRPDVDTLRKEIREINLYYQNNPNELPQLKTKLNEGTNHANTSSKLFTSKIHKFENLPKPKNATEEEQEIFHSKLYDFYIPDNIGDFGQSNNQNNNRSSNVIEVDSRIFSKLRVDSKNVAMQNNYYNRETIQQPRTVDVDDDDEYNNPNLHSEEQEELEIPVDGF
ncbi:hypothetical protein RclHR1_09800006 [Rhizophagus clarus]|uniref:Protein kinase domain-containing protein n=1 Tax=Rhizophagus clarus TaxID=94130 RepID=A0A2Z6SJ89_9GLOM|nr:hypothetical protein RclHR1_09800006 [Rhizophagus clarus]